MVERFERRHPDMEIRPVLLKPGIYRLAKQLPGEHGEEFCTEDII